ncbi:LamG-like jellyroll fold domain-containing protein [Kitasatospora sp. CM 4170]|uniref:LamG-like jellyroll fold domain-containing protein n=1 Tax=Kitasatospora aburaviensis TaxID=67265 RepID=A0ABW1ETY0_9ACTN|nr:LamG-like jellyroll fold domain-containing protein [Kitasatospora sp. CM 4170]WNM44646.1 LamG-like jellyroll fold domain-containing protein [Kitasatospora sp. CM 4170]
MAPVAFADSVPAAKQSGAAVPPSLAATMAAADAKRAKDKPAVTAADKAIAQAKATKKPVPVPELTDEFSETVATPEGHLSRTQHPDQQRAKQQDGTWATLDATLVADPAGGFRPRNAASGVHLSGGGSGPLGTLTSADGETLAIDSPFPLTKPTLDEDGDGLVYPEVAPGIDLKVTADKSGGLSTVLIVKTAEAAKNPKLKKVRFGTSGKGVSVKADAAGNLTATTKDGATRWHAPTPQMWDSSAGTVTPASPAEKGAKAAPAAPAGPDGGAPTAAAPAKSGKVSTADGPAAGAKVATMPTTTTGDAIELTTDDSVLGKGQGPWFIDPGWIPDRREGNAWTWTQSAYPGTSRFGQTTATNGQYARPGVGYQGYLTDKGVERSYFQFDTRGYGGTVVNKATLTAWEYESSNFSCTDKYWLDLYLTGPISNETTWSKPPGVVGGGRIGEAQVAGSGGQGCHDNVPFSYDITSTFRDYAPSRDTLTFGVFARDEVNRLGFKRLDYRPVITVEYDRVPDTPTNQAAWPAPATAVPWAENQGCDGSSLAWMSAGSNFNGAVTLNATVHSPVQNSLYSWTHIWDYTLPGVPDVDSGFSGEVGNGGNAAFGVRGDVIKDGHVYGWSAHATDKLIGMSDSTPTCRFGVDLTPPSISVPDVYSTLSDAELADRFPPSGNGQATKKRAGEWGIVPFTAVDNAPDGGTPSGVMCARFAWEPQFAGVDWQCGSSLSQGGIGIYAGRWGTNIGYIQVMDNARNVSPVAQYAFYVPWNPDGPPPVFGDVTGDSAPDIVTPDQAGDLRAYTVPGNPQAKSPAVSLVAKREDSPTGQGWGDIQFAHRGTFTGGNNIDDIVAHAPGDKNLWLYGNPGNTGYYGRVDSRTLLAKPKCATTATEDCSWRTAADYNATDWSRTLRVASLGDPVSTDLDYKLQFKNKSGLLTVESTNNGTDAALWYYPATAGNVLGKPVRLAASGWKDKELITPGDWAKQGHPGLWSRNLEAAADGAKGDLLAHTFTTGTVPATDGNGRPMVDATGRPVTVPTLTGIATATKIGGVPVDGWPTMGSDGDLTGKGFPTLWGKGGDGRVDIWWGETANPGTANAGFTWQVGPQTVANTGVNPLWYALDAQNKADSNYADPARPSAKPENPLYPNAFTRTADHNGAADRATVFDGSSTFYRSTNQANIDTTQSYTVAAWVKLNNRNGYQNVVTLTGAERSPFYLQYSAAFGKWALVLPHEDYLNTGAYYSAVDDHEPDLGVWTHLVGTYNAQAGTITLYVNGRATGSAQVPNTWKATGSLNIGGAVTSRFTTPEGLLNGAIGDVRVYPYAFTETQANALATTGSRVQLHSSYNPGKCIDDWGGAVGALVAVHDCWNGDSQHFTLTTDSRIKVRGDDNRCLGIADKPAQWGSKVQIQACSGSDPGQIWVRRFDGALYNPGANSCLELPGWNTANGTALGIWECNANPNQRWFARAQLPS